jgi:hypothetical protein
MPAHDKRHHQGDYPRRAAAVRAAAYGDPTTRCWRCGLTLEEAKASNSKVRWQAGHLVDGQAGGALRPEHSTCNASAGAAYGNAKREPRSQSWT